MAAYSNTITLGGVTLEIVSATPQRGPKKRKTVIGKQLIQTNIIGINAQQWAITITGIITPPDLSTKRASIEALDNATIHALVDGIHDGNYYVIPNSLQFDDNGENAGMIYRYSMQIVEV